MGGLKRVILIVLLLVVSAIASPRAGAQLISGTITLSTGGNPSCVDDNPGSGGVFTGSGPNTNGADGYEIAAKNYDPTPDNLPPNVTFAWLFSDDSQSGSHSLVSFTAAGFDDFETEMDGSTVISLATGCTSISQITDASSYALTSGSLDVQNGDFLILKNTTAGYSGYFGVVQMTSGTTEGDGTATATFNWWLLTDGSANFSITPAPEPSTLSTMLLAGGFGFFLFYQRRSQTKPDQNGAESIRL